MQQTYKTSFMYELRILQKSTWFFFQSSTNSWKFLNFLKFLKFWS